MTLGDDMSKTTSKTTALDLFLVALSDYDQAAANYHLNPTDETWLARAAARGDVIDRFTGAAGALDAMEHVL